MPVETERKFLVRDDAWRSAVTSKKLIRQRVILRDPCGAIVRVRQKGTEGFLTIKGPKTNDGLSCPEFEWRIPVSEVEEMKSVFGSGGIEKTRHEVAWDGHLWEVDVFHGENEGLILAEIEFAAPELTGTIVLPPWLGAEVTADPRYANAYIERHPFPQWGVTPHSSGLPGRGP